MASPVSSPILALSAWMLLALTGGAAGAGDGDYRLGPQDKVSLKVYEWRAAINKIHEWKSFNDEFMVGTSGAVSLPLIGEVPAAGSTTAALAKAVGERMKARMGLAHAPDVAVEVVQYRPFYIVGAVERAGEYAYRPGLTVLQALSIAGGLQRIGDGGLLRVERDVITARGELRQLAAQASALLARRARLEAERDDAGAIHFPPELERRETDPAVALLMRQERAIFAARRTGLKTQIAVLEQLKTHLDQEVHSLKAQLDAHRTERGLVKKELGNITALVSRGLAVSPRQIELERTVAQLEGQRLRLETNLLKARQEISRTDIAILETRNKHASEVTAELRETQASLEQTTEKIETAEKLLYEAETLAPRLLGERYDAGQAPRYSIARRVDGKLRDMTVEESAGVKPGDTVRVTVPVADRHLPTSAWRLRAVQEE